MIQSLRLQKFRSYKDESFEFNPGVNIVVGPNACGKTNLLEAVLILARGNSYRGKDVELVAFKAPWARLDGAFDSQNRSVKLIRNGETVTKSFIIDDKPFTRLGFERTVPVVVFEPEHLLLLTHGPERRREFIDLLLEQTMPAFKSLRYNYKRALLQRNTLLKKGGAHSPDQLFVWNIRLSELGGEIVRVRLELIRQINEVIAETYSSIAHRKTKLTFGYATSLSTDQYSSRLLSKLEKSAELDLRRGFTAHGPHREDINIMLDGQIASAAASRGETRTLLLALKIFELGLIAESRGQQPIFLLDDVFSELDGSRRRYLVKHLKDQQTIITTTDADAVIEHFIENYQVVAI